MTIHVLKAEQAKRLAEKLVQPFVAETKAALAGVESTAQTDARKREDAIKELKAIRTDLQAALQELRDSIKRIDKTETAQSSIRGEMSAMVVRFEELSNEVISAKSVSNNAQEIAKSTSTAVEQSMTVVRQATNARLNVAEATVARMEAQIAEQLKQHVKRLEKGQKVAQSLLEERVTNQIRTLHGEIQKLHDLYEVIRTRPDALRKHVVSNEERLEKLTKDFNLVVAGLMGRKEEKAK